MQFTVDSELFVSFSKGGSTVFSSLTVEIIFYEIKVIEFRFMTVLQPHYVIYSSGQKLATEGVTYCKGGYRISEKGKRGSYV